MKIFTLSSWFAVSLLMVSVMGCQKTNMTPVSNSAPTVTPSGAMSAPVVSLSMVSMTFANTPVGTAAATQAITLTNTGNEALSLSGTGLGITIIGTNASSYSQVNTCSTSVVAGASCTITVAFNPTASGTLNAAVSIAADVAGTSQTVPLSGTGIAAAAISSSGTGTYPVVSLSIVSMTFASTPVDTAAATQAITLTNTGNGALSLSGTGLGITITGTNSTSYSQTNTCGMSVAAGASCTITVTFNPTASGTLNAAVSIAADVAGTSQTVPLSGTGIAAAASSPSGTGTYPVVSLSMVSMTFVSTSVGVTSEPQTITLYNTGDAPLSFSGSGLGISISGANASSYSQINQCGTSVAAGGSCAITVTFSPTGLGTLNANVSIVADLTGTLQIVPLSGTGIAAAASSSSGTGNVYYVDNTIPDINVASATPDCTTYNPSTFVCGTGSATAFATIADLNYHSWKPGDTFLFRRGDIWREQLNIVQNIYNISGAPGEPFTLGAFGDPASPRPIISGTNLFTNWLPIQVSNGTVTATVYNSQYTVIPSTAGNYESRHYATIPTQIFEDGTRLTQNTTSANSLAAGQWYLDTANSEIWVRMTGDDNPNGHILEASQRDYGIEIYGVSYVTISSLQTEKTNNVGIDMNAAYDNNCVISDVVSNYNYIWGIKIVNSTNEMIINSTAAYNGGEGIFIYQTSNVTIDGNTVHDNGQLDTVLGQNESSGINGAGPLVTNLIVQNNLIYSNGVVGVSFLRGMDFDTIGPGAIIRYNMIYSNTGYGIEFDADIDETAYGNVVFNNGSTGIKAFADGLPQMTGMLIYNNTVYGNYNGGIYMEGNYALPNSCMNNTVTNNIAMNSITSPNLTAIAGCENDGVHGSGNIYTFNDFGPNSSNFIEWACVPRPMYISTYEAWESAAGNCGSPGCSHSVETDPLFTSTSTNNFTLSQYSPTIGAGLNLGLAYQYDLNPASTWPSNVILNSQNNSRGGWTIGAYTYTNLSVVNSTVNSALDEEVPAVQTVSVFY